MPKDEPENINESTENKGTDKQLDHKSELKAYHKRHNGLMLVSIVVAVLLFLAVADVAGGFFMRDRNGFASEPNGITTVFERSRPPRGMMSQVVVDNSSSTVTTTTTNITSGVVTSVSGSNFVIAGNGNQYTVKTTGDTTYNTTDKKVTANDSVVVVGKISDKTITATDVRIANF